MKKKAVGKGTGLPVRELLFNKFKKSAGISVFMVKYDNDAEKEIYDKVLGELEEHDYLGYKINFRRIQIFLTDTGKKIVQEQDSW